MAKKSKKHNLDTLHMKVPNVIAYAVLILLFIAAVKMVKVATEMNTVLETPVIDQMY